MPRFLLEILQSAISAAFLLRSSTLISQAPLQRSRTKRWDAMGCDVSTPVSTPGRSPLQGHQGSATLGTLLRAHLSCTTVCNEDYYWNEDPTRMLWSSFDPHVAVGKYVLRDWNEDTARMSWTSNFVYVAASTDDLYRWKEDSAKTASMTPQRRDKSDHRCRNSWPQGRRNVVQKPFSRKLHVSERTGPAISYTVHNASEELVGGTEKGWLAPSIVARGTCDRQPSDPSRSAPSSVPPTRGL